jgi:multicomponent Na+:H+ antiporter subunit E
MKYRIQTTLFLWAVYISLTQKSITDVPNLFFGAAIASIVSFLFPPRAHSFNRYDVLPFFIGLFQYAWLVIKDMFKSAYNVAKIVLDPKLPIRPGIIAIDAGCKSELATALSAHAITLTPGEMVVAMDENGILYTHTLDIDRSDEYAEHAQSLRRNLLSKLVS